MSSRREDTWTKERAQGLGGTERGQCGRRIGDMESTIEMGMRGRGCGLCGVLWVAGSHEDISHGDGIHGEFKNLGAVKADG